MVDSLKSKTEATGPISDLFREYNAEVLLDTPLHRRLEALLSTAVEEERAACRQIAREIAADKYADCSQIYRNGWRLSAELVAEKIGERK